MRPGRVDRLGPRLVVAATHSGAGKTTVATGLMAALSRRGTKVAGAKVGPDFIDPGYHAAACGRPGRNLDPWICGPEALAPLAARAGRGAEILVVEGVMGLFDGAAIERHEGPHGGGDSAPPAARRGLASTAEVAALLQAPVVLVVDAAGISGSVAALVQGFASFDPAVTVSGVVLNRVGSESHELMLRRALEPLGVAVLGALRRDDRFRWQDRHLGLLPVVEQPGAVRRSLDVLAARIDEGCDVAALAALATRAPALQVGELPPARRVGTARVAVTSGKAFSFAYRDNLERLEEAGAELVEVDPLEDRCLPDGTCGLYAGGGFPETFGEPLAANGPLLAGAADRVRQGLPTWAECGGLLWLSESLDGRRLCGAIPARATMTDRLTLGYRRATATRDALMARAGETLLGHEFHYSSLEPAGDALELAGREGRYRGGFGSASLLASYLHLHLGADPLPAERFVAAAARYGAARLADGAALPSSGAAPRGKPVGDRRVESSL